MSINFQKMTEGAAEKHVHGIKVLLKKFVDEIDAHVKDEKLTPAEAYLISIAVIAHIAERNPCPSIELGTMMGVEHLLNMQIHWAEDHPDAYEIPKD